MKVAVYTIACNEQEHVKRWAASCADADLRIVGDTGSTDLTVQRLKMQGCEVIRNIAVKPWRFDVPRNTVLSLIPADVDWCICLDLDEVLHEGWRDQLDDLGTRKNGLYHWQGGPLQERIRKDAGLETLPPTYFWDDRRIHRRFGYAWRYPCHEELFSYGGNEDELVDCGIVIEHLPDPNKDRGQYFDILSHAANDECWASARMQHYYGRELAYRGQYDKAVDYFRRCAQRQMAY